MTNPTLYMLVGVPGSGKSTWIANNFEYDGTLIASTDNFIEFTATRLNKTYNEIFKETISFATDAMMDDVQWAVSNDVNIIWDQTNITAKARAKKLAHIPKNYKKIAVFFPTPEDDEWTRRLESRPNKTIPNHVLEGMMNMIEMPTVEEGFDEIIIVQESK